MCENEELDMDDSLGVFLDKCRKFQMFCFCFEVQEDIQRNYPELSFEEIHKLRLGDIWHHIQGLEPRKKRRKQDPLRGITIDELLKKDKSSYAISYDDLDWICLNKSFFGSSLNFKGEKIWKLIKINKKQSKQLSQILPRIDALKGKLEIN